MIVLIYQSCTMYLLLGLFNMSRVNVCLLYYIYLARYLGVLHECVLMEWRYVNEKSNVTKCSPTEKNAC